MSAQILNFIVATVIVLVVAFAGMVAIAISDDLDTSCPVGTTWEQGPAVPVLVGKVIVLQYPSAGCK